MPPKDWKPPEGFKQTGLLIREDYYRTIRTFAARTGKKPWEVLDQILGRGLEGIEVPPLLSLDALIKTPRKRKP